VRRFGLRVLLVGATVLLSGAAVVAVGMLAMRLVGRLADAQALARVALARSAALDTLERTGGDAEAAARRLAERPALGPLLAARDRAGIDELLARFAGPDEISGCALLRGGGVVAASRDADLPWSAVAARAERERADAGWFVPDSAPGEPLVVAAVHALSGPHARGVKAAVVRRLDDAWALRVESGIGLAVRVIDRHSALAAAPGPLAALWGRAAAEGQAGAERIDALGAFVAVVPIEDPSGARAGVLDVRLGTSAVDASVARLARVLTLATLAVLACATVAALLLARGIVRPLEALTRASARIGRGDLATPIPRAASGEVGVLAATMEEMRDRLLGLTAELRQRQAEAEAVLGGIADGVFVVDRERRVSYLNPQAAALLGLRREDAIGRFCGDVLNPEGAGGGRPCDDECPILDARFRGGARAVERLVLPDGRRRTVVITSAAPAAAGAGAGAANGDSQFQVIRDETEEEAGRRLRDIVLANVSHEFRTPLSAQLASLEMIRERLQHVRAEDLEHLVQSVERATLRLTRLVDNLLESLRIEAGRDAIRHLPLDLDQVVEEAVEATLPLIHQKRQQLEVNLPVPLPPLSGDPQLLTQVFVNLLANANKFAPAGSLIMVGAEVDAGQIAVWVEDRGPGLPDDADGTLFERFRRAGGADGEEGGMGLGLWIVRSIVTRHDGRVEARNTGSGARFTVVLPRADAHEDPGG
jgi:signal transduction histidine kinase